MAAVRRNKKVRKVFIDGEPPKLDAKAVIDTFEGVFGALFSKPERVQTNFFAIEKQRYEQELVDDVFRVAALWQRQRLDPRVTRKMDPAFLRALDEIEKKTRGDDRRCECLAFKDSKGAYHDAACPARKRP
jgi:hypothetical protein